MCNLRNRVWKPLLVKTGLPTNTHIHALRHSAITLLLSERVPVNVVSDMAGHGDPAVTLSIYGWSISLMQAYISCFFVVYSLEAPVTLLQKTITVTFGRR